MTGLRCATLERRFFYESEWNITPLAEECSVIVFPCVK